MLIELHREQVGRWYWVTYPVAGGQPGVRLAITRMDPNNIAVKQIMCTVYGVCDYSRVSWYENGGECYDYRWVARKIGFGRGHGDFECFYSLEDAKAWLLTGVASRLRQSKPPAAKYASPFQLDYKYEAIGC